MQITGLEIYSYGRFHQEAFEIHQPLQIIYGPNESGKTTLFDFIYQVLFGFESYRKPHKRHDHEAGRLYGGRLYLRDDIHGDGWVERSGREKVKGSVVFYFSDGFQGKDKEWELYLEDQHVTIFRDSLALDLNLLTIDRSLKKNNFMDFLKRTQSLSHRKFSQIQEDLRRQADDLYLEKSYKRPIDQKAEEIQEIDRDLSQARQRHEDYMQLQAEKATWQDQQWTADSDYIKAKEEWNRLDQLEDHIEDWDRYRANQRILNSIDVKDWQLADQLQRDIQKKDQEKTALKTELESESLQMNHPYLQWRYRQGEDYHAYLDYLDQLMDYEEEKKRLKTDYLQVGQHLSEAREKMGLESPYFQLLDDQLLSSFDQGSSSGSSKQVKLLIVLGILLLVSAFVFRRLELGLLAIILLGIYYLKENNTGKPPKSTGWQGQLKNHGLPQDWTVQDYLWYQPMLESYLASQAEMEEKEDQVDQIEKQEVQHLKSMDQLDLPIDLTLDLAQDIGLIRAFNRQLKELDKDRQQGQEDLDQLNHRLSYIDEVLQKSHQDLDILLKKMGIDRDQIAPLGQRLEEQSYLEEALAPFKDYLSADWTLESIRAYRQNLQEEIKTFEKDRQSRVDQGLDLQNEIKAIEEGGTYQALLQKRTDLLSQWRQLNEDWLKFKVADYLIEATLNQSLSQQLDQSLKQAAAYLQELTAGRYRAIEIQEDQLIISGPAGTWPVDVLSRGTQDQVYLCLRLAFMVENAQKYSLPILLDDPMVNFDEDRRRRFRELVHNISKDQQIILFTLDKEWVEAKDHVSPIML